MIWRTLSTAVFAFGLGTTCGLAGTLTPLAHPAPEGVGVAYQLTDGRVLVQGSSETRFYILTPDKNGSYVNGTWTKTKDLPANYSPLYFSGAVLADGRVIVEGGEYQFDNFALNKKGYVYDPQKDSWTKLAPPPTWKFIGDSSNAIMPDGKFVVAQKISKKLASLDPSTMTWTELGATGKRGVNSEEGLTLLPDGSLLIVNVTAGPHTQRWFPSDQTWHDAGKTPVSLIQPGEQGCIPYGKNKCYHPAGETGPAILRPDGTVFATGGQPASGPAHTAIYNPAMNKWTKGPDFPNSDNAGDNFAVLLPSGNVLVQGAQGSPYEFDGKKLVIQSVCTCGESLMILPTGEVLVGGDNVYRATGTYQSAWQPAITNAPGSVNRGSTYQISGTQFNGLSQANAFGDEEMTATNYPLVRITNTANRTCVLRPHPRSQHDGRGNGQHTGLDQLRRSGRDGNRCEQAGGGSQRYSVDTGFDHGELRRLTEHVGVFRMAPEPCACITAERRDREMLRSRVLCDRVHQPAGRAFAAQRHWSLNMRNAEVTATPGVVRERGETVFNQFEPMSGSIVGKLQLVRFAHSTVLVVSTFNADFASSAPATSTETSARWV